MTRSRRDARRRDPFAPARGQGDRWIGPSCVDSLRAASTAAAAGAPHASHAFASSSVQRARYSSVQRAWRSNSATTSDRKRSARTVRVGESRVSTIRFRKRHHRKVDHRKVAHPRRRSRIPPQARRPQCRPVPGSACPLRRPRGIQRAHSLRRRPRCPIGSTAHAAASSSSSSTIESVWSRSWPTRVSRSM